MATAFPKTTNAVNGPLDSHGGENPLATLPYSGWWVPNEYPAIVENWGSVKTPVAPANFLRHFNIYISAISGWTLGYLKETGTDSFPYTTDLDDIKVDTTAEVTKLQNSFTAVPSGQTDIGATTATAQGYFSGTTFEIYRIVAITNGSRLFLIKVLIQDVLQNPDDEDLWKSSVVFEAKYFDGLSIPVAAAKLSEQANEAKSFVDFITKKALKK